MKRLWIWEDLCIDKGQKIGFAWKVETADISSCRKVLPPCVGQGTNSPSYFIFPHIAGWLTALPPAPTLLPYNPYSISASRWNFFFSPTAWRDVIVQSEWRFMCIMWWEDGDGRGGVGVMRMWEHLVTGSHSIKSSSSCKVMLWI